MNIQRTVTNLPPRAAAQKAYQKAQLKQEQAETAFLDHFRSYSAEADRSGFRAGMGTGIAVTGAVLGLAVSGFAARPFSAEIAIAACTLGAAMGIGVGAGVQLLGQRRGRLEADITTRPAMLEARGAAQTAREQFRDSLLSEMNDDGVVQETEETWNKLRADESQAHSWKGLKDTQAELSTEIQNLTLLADGRQADGWLGELANLEDSPSDFKLQKDTVEAHPSLKQMVQS